MAPLALVVLAWLWWEEERHRDWLENDPGQPWNVQIRLAREAEAWYRDNYNPVPQCPISSAMGDKSRVN